jgi:pyruvate dehydrogenase E2 component (dihydrolipoamide acetyltransferase)
MAEAIVLPQFGQTMEEGTILRFDVNEGDRVNKGDVIFEVETEKTTLEVESSAEGFVKKILVKVGQIVPVNTAVMVLGDKEEKVSEELVKSLLDKVDGQAFRRETGDSVSAKAEQLCFSESAYGLGMKIPVSEAQAVAAERMLESKRGIPCFYLNTSVNVGRVLDLCAPPSERTGAEVSIEDFIIRAVALGLVQFPVMSGQLSGGGFICLADKICVGLVVGTERGPVAVVIEGAGDKSVVEIACCREELIANISDEFSFDNLAIACITVSSLGAGGVDLFVPVVIPGQCSILGVGGVKELCVPVDGDFVIRKSLNLALSVDHRIANGAEAAQFLGFVKRTLEDADSLVL